MIWIGICDDEPIFREQLVKICKQYFEGKEISYGLVEFESAEEVLAYQGETLILLFLDVELGGRTGIELKDELEKSDRVWRIVFVTSHEEAVWDSFGLKTLGFVTKPVSFKTVEKWISLAVRENKENRVFEFTIEKRSAFFRQDEISYFESNGNYAYLYREDEKIFVDEGLKKCEQIVEGSSFVRIHKSYLVNMQAIKDVSFFHVILKSGRELPIGRSYREEVKKRYYAYLKEVAMGRL